MIHAIAIDDEPPALRVIENFCKRLDFLTLEKTFSGPTEAQRHLDNFPVDLIFLDIQMPAMPGTEFYQRVSQETMVIFTTAHSEYAVEGFNLRAVDYLLKPFTFERFHEAVSRAQEYHQMKSQSGQSTPQHILIRADYSLLKVSLAEILYVEGLDDYVQIWIKGKPRIVARMTMKQISEKLPSDRFIRVHKSFVISLEHIEQVRSKTITISAREIPIGKSYESDFLHVFKG